jgi:hypothetical protein
MSKLCGEAGDVVQAGQVQRARQPSAFRDRLQLRSSEITPKPLPNTSNFLP